MRWEMPAAALAAETPVPWYVAGAQLLRGAPTGRGARCSPTGCARISPPAFAVARPPKTGFFTAHLLPGSVAGPLMDMAPAYSRQPPAGQRVFRLVIFSPGGADEPFLDHRDHQAPVGGEDL